MLASSMVIGLARADVINWTSDVSGIWNLGANWDAPFPPGPTDDAKHLVKLNHIQVAGDRSCWSFLGKGGIKTNADRFVVVEAGKLWTVGGGGLRRAAGSDANFVVKLENGLDDQNRTRVSGGGATDGIHFVPGDKQKGNYIDITSQFILIDSTIALSNNVTFSNTVAGGGIRDTSIAVGNDAIFDILGDVTGPGDHTVGCSFGNRGNIVVAGDVNGLDMTFGTSSAQSETDSTYVTVASVGIPNPIADDWTLQGYADIAVTQCLHACVESAAGQGATFLLQDHARMTIGFCPQEYPAVPCSGSEDPPQEELLVTSIVAGTWTVKDNASLVAGAVAYLGYWTVQDAAEVHISGRFMPYALTVDGGLFACSAFGRSFLTSDVLFKNGGQLSVEFSADHPGFAQNLGANSTLTYEGLGNNYTAQGPIKLGGTLVKGGWGANLKMEIEKGLVVSSKLVTTTDPPIDFDAEGVSLTLASTAFAPDLEVFGPDYEGGNPGNVLFTDSPCVRRWQALTVDAVLTATLENGFASTPITVHRIELRRAGGLRGTLRQQARCCFGERLAGQWAECLLHRKTRQRRDDHGRERFLHAKKADTDVVRQLQ